MSHEFTGFRVVHRLYTSPRSVVDRVVRLVDGATVILKQPAEDVVFAEGFRRIQSEHDMLRGLRGAGVAEALAVVRDGSRCALVLEDLGSVLAAGIAGRRLHIGDALDVGIEVARCLGRIHGRGIVHKDINPNNIAYDPSSRAVKIIDFDLASQVGSGAQVAGAVLEGTLHYLAPEQTGRLNRPIDARSDLYSLGITLYELLAGRRPFAGDDPLALVHAHLAEEPLRVDAIDPRIPSVVGDIVMKLIAKAPERRYQTAGGLLADLERCRRELSADAQITAFAIGEHDVVPRFELVDRLYGRDAEIGVLLEAFARVARGGNETVLISGYSGIGKSSLVREIDRRFTGGGYFASGKFEQLNRDTPYSAIVGALDELIAQILAGPALDRWRSDIAAAVGDAGALVRSVVPAIERVLGPQPPAHAADPEVARHRLGRAMARLIQVFARKPHPLVLFLDDMQWADAASLQLLTELAASETEALLVIEAFRGGAMDAAHPFAVAVQAFERQGGRISRIALAPLTLEETTELVGDALRQPQDAIAAAAAVIWHKTDGNPFFVRRFLHALHDEGFIVFEPGANRFTLDAAALDRAAITENVADLLAHQLGKLPAATRDALVAAAALGNQFDAVALARVLAVPAAELGAMLAPAVVAGMLGEVTAPARVDNPRYRFQHDRIQQAAYEAAELPVRERLHLTIGRQLLSGTGPGELDERLFEIVHHLDRGLGLIELEPERARFVELALAAAHRARRSGAVDVAESLLRSVLSVRDWQAHHDTAFSASVELAEVLSLGGLHPAAREIVQAAIEHATPRERATLAAFETKMCIRLGLMTEALVHGRRAAALLGVELPADPAALGERFAAELGTVMAAIAARPIEQWIDLPRMTGPDKLATMALLIECIPAAYQCEPALMALISVKLVTLSLGHGNCLESARGYVSIAITMWVIGEYAAGIRLGELGLALVKRLDAGGVAPAIEFTFWAFVSPWRDPAPDTVERTHAMVSRSLEAGDIAHAAYSALFAVLYETIWGHSLDKLIDNAQRYRQLCARLGLHELHGAIGWTVQHARGWTGAPPPPGEIALDFVATDRALEAAAGSRSLLAVHRIMELERRYWAGDTAGAAALSAEIAPLLGCLPANLHLVEYSFYRCLTAIAVDGAGAELGSLRADLARYAEICPANFRHKAALVDAELARVSGDLAAAIALYDVAIDAAAEHGFLKVEILAHEQVARLWIERDKPAFAAVHLAKARDLCEHWGAKPRARELELARRRLGATVDAHTTMRSSSAFVSTLDFATVLKASHAIASDVVLDSLLAKMMEIIIENTGAQAGSIVLATSGALSIHASKQPGAAIVVSGGLPLADARDVSEGIVKYVVRTAECVVLGDATRHPTFRIDPYVRERRPRSVLCLPIVHQERMIGAVYLENNLVANAFTVERLDALGILVAQLAISIENAMMVSGLEDLVVRRTQALIAANQQLREQALVRERIESELRLAQKLQSVGQLAAGVAHEINTPMQFIGDNISFLNDALDELFAVIAAYQAAIDPATGRVDLAAIGRADQELDLEFVRNHARSACQQARDGVSRVSRIVVAMRAFSHPDRQDQAATSLQAALENTLVVAHNEYRDVADVATDFGDMPDVVCHPGEINQVFLNLLVNAAQAIEDVVKPDGARGTITIRTRREGADTAVIEIGDTGGGIPEAIRDRVFDPFFTTKEVGRGTGQGLALARAAIVDRHGGTIDFETRIGGGTTFFIRLPIRGRAAAHTATHAAANP